MDDEHGEEAESEQGDGEDVPDITQWSSTNKKITCPACGASGALTLGGGVFCPTCGEVSTNPGYTPGS